MLRNRGPASTGTVARHAPETGAGMDRNPQAIAPWAVLSAPHPSHRLPGRKRTTERTRRLRRVRFPGDAKHSAAGVSGVLAAGQVRQSPPRVCFCPSCDPDFGVCDHSHSSSAPVPPPASRSSINNGFWRVAFACFRGRRAAITSKSPRCSSLSELLSAICPSRIGTPTGAVGSERYFPHEDS